MVLDTRQRLKISFYTTCMGRLKHVKRTLPQNIKDNQDYDNVEFVLLDYNSQDGLEEWVKANMAEHIKSGLLVYAKTTQPTFFFHNHAKNMAARLCTGDIVCGIDADNFTALGDKNEGLALYLNDIFKVNLKKRIFARARGWEHKEKFWHSINTYKYYSCSGKIACLRSDFMKYRGYDEHLQGHYFDEEEFWKRLEIVCHLHHVRLPISFSKAITHTNFERLKNLNPKIVNKSELKKMREGNLKGVNNQIMTQNWVRLNYLNGAKNQKICQSNLDNKIATPNEARKWGKGTVIINFNKKRVL